MWPYDAIDPAEAATASFFQFMDLSVENDFGITLRNPCLADLILLWLTDGAGLEYCGTFESYLTAIIAIMDSWSEEERAAPGGFWLTNSRLLRDDSDQPPSTFPFFRDVETEEKTLRTGQGYVPTRYLHPVLNRATFDYALNRRARLTEALMEQLAEVTASARPSKN